jgi:hypothetical protein
VFSTLARALVSDTTELPTHSPSASCHHPGNPLSFALSFI